MRKVSVEEILQLHAKEQGNNETEKDDAIRSIRETNAISDANE